MLLVPPGLVRSYMWAMATLMFWDLGLESVEFFSVQGHPAFLVLFGISLGGACFCGVKAAKERRDVDPFDGGKGA